MKNNRYRSIVLIAILLFGFMIVANLPLGNTTVARAAAQFLSSVVHDATLTGNGTNSSPLGVATSGIATSQLADNSVTASKIASGQVVKSLNSLKEDVILAAGSNISIATNGNTLVVSSLSGLTSVAHDDTLLGDGTGGSPLSVKPQPYINPKRVATLQWFETNKTGISVPVGSSPYGIAFDGAHVWVVNLSSNNVTKIRTSDGANLGTFDVGSQPWNAAFDGANIWITNGTANTVTKLKASDGANLGTFNVGSSPHGIAFDGANIWVTNRGSNNVTKLRARDGANQGTFSVGLDPRGIAFDGTNIWVTNGTSNNVTKLRASDGANLGNITFSSGAPWGIAFDGVHIWVANSGNIVTKLRASDGASVGTFVVTNNLCDTHGITFDGVNIWVTDQENDSVFKLRANDGVVLDSFRPASLSSAGGTPHVIAFDGANVWIPVGGGPGHVMKF